MSYRIAELDDNGNEKNAITVPSIEVIPPGGELLFILPAEVMDADFEIIKEQIRERFSQRRQILVMRAGDIDIKWTATEEGDATNG